jgi:hypothetical protein
MILFDKKKLSGANTLAYLASAAETKEKSFTLVPGVTAKNFLLS